MNSLKNTINFQRMMGKNWSVLIFEPLPNSARARTVTAAATVSTQQTAGAVGRGPPDGKQQQPF